MRSIYLPPLITASVVLFAFMSEGVSEHPQVAPQAIQRQQPLQPPKKYMDEGVVEHAEALATLKVNDPRPLRQAISTLNQEYGWLIDYEDPPYMSGPELLDITDPQRRATNPKHRVTIPAGDSFRFQYEEKSLDSGPLAVQAFLHRLAAAYNQSGNPGKFTIRKQEKGRYTVIGTAIKNDSGRDEGVSPILDTPLSVSIENRPAIQAIDEILKALSATTNKKVGMGWIPNNLFRNTRITVSGENVSARSLLLQAFNATGRPLVYDLMYFEDTDRYLLGATVAVRAYRDSFGRKTLIPLDSKPRVTQ